jgi:hypothetical protein
MVAVRGFGGSPFLLDVSARAFYGVAGVLRLLRHVVAPFALVIVPLALSLVAWPYLSPDVAGATSLVLLGWATVYSVLLLLHHFCIALALPERVPAVYAAIAKHAHGLTAAVEELAPLVVVGESHGDAAGPASNGSARHEAGWFWRLNDVLAGIPTPSRATVVLVAVVAMCHCVTQPFVTVGVLNLVPLHTVGYPPVTALASSGKVNYGSNRSRSGISPRWKSGGPTSFRGVANVSRPPQGAAATRRLQGLDAAGPKRPTAAEAVDSARAPEGDVDADAQQHGLIHAQRIYREWRQVAARARNTQSEPVTAPTAEDEPATPPPSLSPAGWALVTGCTAAVILPAAPSAAAAMARAATGNDALATAVSFGWYGIAAAIAPPLLRTFAGSWWSPESFQFFSVSLYRLAARGGAQRTSATAGRRGELRASSPLLDWARGFFDMKFDQEPRGDEAPPLFFLPMAPATSALFATAEAAAFTVQTAGSDVVTTLRSAAASLYPNETAAMRLASFNETATSAARAMDLTWLGSFGAAGAYAVAVIVAPLAGGLLVRLLDDSGPGSSPVDVASTGGSLASSLSDLATVALRVMHFSLMLHAYSYGSTASGKGADAWSLNDVFLPWGGLFSALIAGCLSAFLFGALNWVFCFYAVRHARLQPISITNRNIITVATNNSVQTPREPSASLPPSTPLAPTPREHLPFQSPAGRSAPTTLDLLQPRRTAGSQRNALPQTVAPPRSQPRSRTAVLPSKAPMTSPGNTAVSQSDGLPSLLRTAPEDRIGLFFGCTCKADVLAPVVLWLAYLGGVTLSDRNSNSSVIVSVPGGTLHPAHAPGVPALYMLGVLSLYCVLFIAAAHTIAGLLALGPLRQWGLHLLHQRVLLTGRRLLLRSAGGTWLRQRVLNAMTQHRATTAAASHSVSASELV